MPATVKDAVQEVLQSLPDDCSWNDVMYRLYVRREIEAGLRDIEEGRLIDHEDVFRELLSDEDYLDGKSPAASEVHPGVHQP